MKIMRFFQTFGISLSLVLAVTIGFQEIAAQEFKHIPSDQRGDPRLRRKSNIDGNNIRATVFNFGLSGRTAARPDEIAYEWPKNTKRIYIALVAIWLAGEVQLDDGTRIHIVDFPTFRQSPEGTSWNLEPVPGFLNPESGEIARSDDPNSWPTAAQGGWRDKRDDPVDPGWIGSWNGFFGKNVFNADQEMFYRDSDDLYTRFDYVPDETDPTRGGMALLMDVRAFAWSKILINDVLFFVHDILNDGTKRIFKTSFLIWLADIVGGDAADDQPFVDLQTSIAFLTDADRVGTEPFGSDPVGVGSVKYIETPGNFVDGIDNDGDADQYPDLIAQLAVDPDTYIPHFTDADFVPRHLIPGDKIVLIDSTTFNRIITTYPEGGDTVITLGRKIYLPPEGLTVEEDTTANSFDEDFDGLIDERLTLHLERFNEITGTVEPVRYINYLAYDVGDTIKRGFVVPGINTEMSYATVAPMIDESRDDLFDNDHDWNPLQDDLGLDGKEGTGDPGEGDGVPTSGAGTDFPGEPNIDKTDVSETDLIGLTSAIQDPAFGINFNTVSDEYIWRKFMTPGKFYLPRLTGDYDLFVSSGYFPMDPGQRQRMSVSVALAGGGATKQADIDAAVQKQKQARVAYESDYQFARAPLQVTLTAVPGDGKVTLYWDDIAEKSVDRFIQRIGGNPNDFEGYRVYRATDAAFLDAKVITDGQGSPTFLRPIAQFDKKDGITGYHPVDVNGIKFYLGDDTGIKHVFVDSTVTNGMRYFYAVTAYDFGYEPGNIPPTETVIKVVVNPDGSITTGPNVAVVRPRAPVAGYLPADVKEIEHISGSATGKIGYKIIDPRIVKDGHVYQITFEDTVKPGRLVDTLTTKNFTLTDITENRVVLEKSTAFNEGDEVPITDGFQLSFVNEKRVELNKVKSGWNHPEVFPYDFSVIRLLGVLGEQRPADYRLVIGDVGLSTSKDTTLSFIRFPAKPVNFKVINLSENREVAFAFAEIDQTGGEGKFTVDPNNPNNTDTILLLEPNKEGKLVYTWQIALNVKANGRNPEPGDTLNIYLRKPFLSADVYQFEVEGERMDPNLAKQQLDRIRVVPNPYIAAEIWEPRNPFNSGRGPREIHFINLPKKCTIRIYNVDGVLVDVIEHDSSLDNGTAIWDVLSKENLEIAYGIYVYHIEAPGIGEKTGTFAIIK